MKLIRKRNQILYGMKKPPANNSSPKDKNREGEGRNKDKIRMVVLRREERYFGLVLDKTGRDGDECRRKWRALRISSSDTTSLRLAFSRVKHEGLFVPVLI